MKPYEPWEFCKNNELCVYADSSLGLKNREHCKSCIAHRFHQYLSANNQILEPGSELEKVVSEVERLRAENERLREDNCTLSETTTRVIEELRNALAGLEG